ncbi:MAG: hydrogenase/urease maturation nickel metallochaperone HypA [Phycisphaerae bacterium]
MHEHGLAKELWPQLKQLAETHGYQRVRRIEMVVGMLHGVSADFLAHSFEHAFEGTNFQGATVEITIVDPGEEYTPPGADEPLTANGWELLITSFEGDE